MALHDVTALWKPPPPVLECRAAHTYMHRHTRARMNWELSIHAVMLSDPPIVAWRLSVHSASGRAVPRVAVAAWSC